MESHSLKERKPGVSSSINTVCIPLNEIYGAKVKPILIETQIKQTD